MVVETSDSYRFQYFNVYVDVFTDWAIRRGWKTCAMVVTLGAYGVEWSQAFREAWKKKGGAITISRPANYYMGTDFSAPLTAAIATRPDCMLIGGPSATTALVIEQARQMGFKGVSVQSHDQKNLGSCPV